MGQEQPGRSEEDGGEGSGFRRGSVLTSKKRRSMDRADEHIRLNLGCGNKIRDGWVNVDIANNGQEYVADLGSLPFMDNYADEIEAIHVIEHFHIWEALPVLSEWARVLKPGGIARVECPDFVKLLRATCHAGSLSSDQLIYLRMCLYGNFPKKDPNMAHKWAFCGEELAGLMRNAGFKDPRISPAIYHVPDRDLAVVATK